MYKKHDYITNYISPGTVLVAHNGFVYDFPLLLAEIERRPNCLSTQHFVSQSIHFADTLPHLRQVYTLYVQSNQSLLYMNEALITYTGKEGWASSSNGGSEVWDGESLLSLF